MRSYLYRIDYFLLALIAIMAFGITFKLPTLTVELLSYVGRYVVVVLFFVYGARLKTSQVLAGLNNWRVQLGVLVATFIFFPILGIFFNYIFTPVLGSNFATGLLYLTLLPSTVQSSIAFTSIARGDVGSALCAATISNLVGMFATPLLVSLFIGQHSHILWSTIIDVLLLILLPFVLGQLLSTLLGDYLRTHAWITKTVDKGTVLLVVAASVTGASARNLWSEVTVWSAIVLLLVSLVLLIVMLVLTWQMGRLLKMDRPSRIALLMCGSKKSLATGLPMAMIIFPPALVAALTIPVIVFHQLQLIVASFLARKLAKK